MPEYWNAKFGNKNYLLKVLDNPLDRAVGYQGCDKPNNEKEGLLFLFNDEKGRTFHMNNVGFDLVLFGFDKEGKGVCEIPMEANSNKTYSTPPCKFVIEIAKDFCSDLNEEDLQLQFTS